MPKSVGRNIWETFDPDFEPEASKLDCFLRDANFSVAREEMLRLRLLADLKAAAAKSNYHLQSYQPDVDRDGHDVILEDSVRIIYLQLKSLYSENTSAWQIRKRLLWPEQRYFDIYKYPQPKGQHDWKEGVQGGVILTEPVLSNGGLDRLKYYYTDLVLIYAAAEGLVPGKEGIDKRMINRLKHELKDRDDSKTVSLRKSVFVEAKGPEELLALAGLKSRLQSTWQLDVWRFISMPPEMLVAQENLEMHHLDRERASGNLRELIVCG